MTIKETDIAKPVIDWLTERGWDVYQEVQVQSGLPVADIVAVLDMRIWVVECKTTLGLDLMAQAVHWQKWAHWVSVAIPRRKQRRQSKANRLAHNMLGAWGVGVFEIQDDTAETSIRPHLCRWAAPWWDGPNSRDRRWHLRDIRTLRESCCEEHKAFAVAGSSGGRHWSPWQDTCRQATRLVVAQPGLSLKELISGISHHYSSDSSARSSMAYWIREGRVRGIELRKEGRRVRLYPRGDA